MKRFILSLALLLALWQLTQTKYLFAGKINFGWNLYNTSGQIYDMEFMPDQNHFIMATENDIQIRNTQTGEIVKTYPDFHIRKFEFTPDSTRLITIGDYGHTLELRNLSDMSLIIKSAPLVVDPEDSIPKHFRETVVDPIRPLVYVHWNKEGKKFGYIDPWISIDKVLIYNYETMKQVGEIPELHAGLLAISKDGKYLATLDGGPSTIRVFSLESMKLIRSFQLCDEYSISGTGGVATCLKFSEINTDNIYFSGSFPESKNVGRYRGLLIYNIQQNRIIDSIFAVPPKFILEGYFDFFQNENKIIDASQGTDFIIDNINKKIEFSIDARAGDPGGWSKFVNRNNTFIGFADIYFSMGQYDSTVGINEDPQIQKIIYPNPTSDFLEISFPLEQFHSKIEIFSIEGIKILESEPVQRIDVSSLMPGVYFVKLGSRVEKFVKI